eukprot:NODE_971_length_2667_cov_8.349606.p1 GENE.NODE_971_length_2667_cov_8.349606~~NODE_971_length_2667_cov_8.349606.p1  ORF type:complete len:820 (+),score=264.57 NODE_971_length_2667_cov_8.349606:235-2460(+)
MTFWKPGAPPPPSYADVLAFDCDAERHQDLTLPRPRARLPMERSRLDFLHAVETHRAVLLCGPTGCGKSTQAPQFLHAAGWAADGYAIAVALPRRVAAVTLATRVAQEMGVECGTRVGYRIRFDARVTPGETRIEFMTEGVLLREMLSDPLLTRFAVVIVDEAHERSVQGDLLLGLLRKVTRKRPRLRLVVASATLEVERFARFFRRSAGAAPAAPKRKRPRCGWDDETGEFHRQREEDVDWRRLCSAAAGDGFPRHDVCVVQVEGRPHDVKIHYLEEPAADYLAVAVDTVMAIHGGEPEGDVLVFLTGADDINAACTMLRERVAEARERLATRARPRPLHVVPLHSSLSKEHQLRAFQPAPRGTRKVVVSTNLAEASVTIDGVVYIVDACLVKLDAFCPHNGASHLSVVPCSRSAARQRAGRAGRTREGFCYRLLTEPAFKGLLPEHTLPEIARCDMKSAVLLLKCLGVDDLGAFEFLSPPSRDALELALEELHALGALDAEARVEIPMGPRMAHAPVPAALTRMLLLAAEPPHCCAMEATTICAMLTLASPWLPTRNAERLQACQESFAVHEGDLVSLLNVARQYSAHRDGDAEWAKRHMLNVPLLKRAVQVQEQLARYLHGLELPLESCGFEVERLQRLACASFFLGAARRLPNGSYRLCRAVDEERAPVTRFGLDRRSALTSSEGTAPAEFVVCVEARCSGGEGHLVHNTRIRPEWLPELAPRYYRAASAAKAVSDI